MFHGHALTRTLQRTCRRAIKFAEESEERGEIDDLAGPPLATVRGVASTFALPDSITAPAAKRQMINPTGSGEN